MQLAKASAPSVVTPSPTMTVLNLEASAAQGAGEAPLKSYMVPVPVMVSVMALSSMAQLRFSPQTPSGSTGISGQPRQVVSPFGAQESAWAGS